MKTRNSNAILAKSLIVPLLWGVLAGRATGAWLSWGSEVFSDFRDSYGNTLDGTYYIQIGFFEAALGEQFGPSRENTSEWGSRWRVFDQASYNADIGYFTSTAKLTETGGSSSEYADLGLNFSGKEAYLWIYNDRNVATGSEWLLARAGDWIFPRSGPGCCDSALPTEWSVSDLSIETPVWGASGGNYGDGFNTVRDANYTLQTFAVVPEPASPVFAALPAIILTLARRGRNRTTARSAR